ncbi:hypothetical protein ACJJTC_005001 [Scirpophaga incertulas]
MERCRQKKIESDYRKELQRTGGGPKPQTPPPEVLEIMDMIPKDFIIDDNKYDSDSIFKKVNKTQSFSENLFDNENIVIEVPSCSGTAKIDHTPRLENQNFINIIDIDHDHAYDSSSEMLREQSLESESSINRIPKEKNVQKENTRKSSRESERSSVIDELSDQRENESSKKQTKMSKLNKRRKLNTNVDLQQQLFDVMKLERTNRIKNENEEHKLKMEILQLQKELLIKSLSQNNN